jgi:hypothetical protein
MPWRRMGSGGIALPFLTSEVDGGEWSASHPSRFTPRDPLYRRLGGPHSPSGRWGEEKNLLSLPGIEPRLLSHPARSPSPIATELSRLSCPPPPLSLYIYNTSVYIKFCNDEWELWNYVISGYHRNELSIVNTLHERKLCSRSRSSEQFFISLRCVYSVSTDHIFMWMCEV